MLPRPVTLLVPLCLLCAAAAPEATRQLAHRDMGTKPAEPPFVLTAVLERIRTVSGDKTWTVDFENYFQPPAPQPAPQPAPVPTPAPKPTPEKEDPFARPKGHTAKDAFAQLDEETGGGGAAPKPLTVEDMERIYSQAFAAWNARYKQEFARWDKENAAWLKRIPIYRERLAPITNGAKVPAEMLARKVTATPARRYKLVSGALDVAVRDQAGRGTCAAFAGARAMDVLLHQNNVPGDVSEQYLYWLAKPDCQSRPCTSEKSGTWTAVAYEQSRSSGRLDIPAESTCRYNPEPQATNETQTPLPPGCGNGGLARVGAWQEVQSTQAIMDALNNDQVVVAGTRLSRNFFETRGLVTLEEARKNPDPSIPHAAGHAYTLVGWMALPPSMHAAEGKVCFLVANSWGSWGVKGHSCITEAWLQEYRFDFPFLALERVEVPAAVR